MTDPKSISILDYTYLLPDERIALRPLEQRDQSKLLIYQNGNISEDRYNNIAQYIPANSLLVFNNSRVIKARIRFPKSTGGVIEIFCLEPHEQVNDYSSVMSRRGDASWKCMIGGAGKWKEKSLVKNLSINNQSVELQATLTNRLPGAYVVQFTWTPVEISFAEIIEAAGDIPLPPYIKRTTDAADSERYQTIYATAKGSVAAPTAGLHFSENIFTGLKEKNIDTAYVTLHVGAGTFRPVKAATMEQHEMHAEWIDCDIALLKKLISQLPGTVTAVGTTSLRTLESLYWLGVKAMLDPTATSLTLSQWELYEMPLSKTSIEPGAALSALLQWLRQNGLERLFTQTQLLITPGYRFRVVKALVTNFHQPQSTLLLLVAAVAGDDWRSIYRYALDHDFRFLSYGDGSLLFL